MIKTTAMILFLSGILWMPLAGGYRVTTVDFLASMDLEVNGVGPLLVRVDPPRNRIVLVNTQSSSITLIDGRTHRVKNVPIADRVPQYLKDEALAVDGKSGNVYVIGNRTLHVVFPATGKSLRIDTGEQYEMVAVDDSSGAACLVGRASRFIAVYRPGGSKLEKLGWVDSVEALKNLNQTPPPPIRKVVWDGALDRIVALDGFTSTLWLFSSKGKLVKKRKLAAKGGARWHFAGYNRDTHHLALVVETARRRVIEAIKVDVRGDRDRIVSLPELTEAVGVCYNARRDEIYIPYDNHPTVHVVGFSGQGLVEEIKVPAYGNDASALDPGKNLLYVSSWAYGEVCAIDVTKRKMVRRYRDLGVIPHMFSMDFNPANGKLYLPIGATAVNGSFGAALTALQPAAGHTEKIRTGWAPVDLVPLRGPEAMMVFNSEDRAARVAADGSVRIVDLPCDYPGKAVALPDGYICLSYGPHQSYWPVVYIWGAKNGILGIEPETLKFCDRRIPRLAQQITLDGEGVLFALQNNWGGEPQFLISLPDRVRSPNQGDMRMELGDRVMRETTQRILRYDPDKNWLYIVRIGEEDHHPGILQIYDLHEKKVLLSYPVGRTPVDLVFDREKVCVSNFDDDNVVILDKSDFSVRKVRTGKHPLKLALRGREIFVVNHGDRTLQKLSADPDTIPLPGPGLVDNLFDTGEVLVLTIHDPGALRVIAYHTDSGRIEDVLRYEYPFGETTLDTDNSSFYTRGQFADAIFELNRFRIDDAGRIWLTDFLAGKLFILEREGR